MSLQGRCLCGGVEYEITGDLPTKDVDLPLPVYCHCKMCQRHTGSAFISATMVPLNQFTLLKGASLVKAYQSSPGTFRSFCTECGSSLFFYQEDFPQLQYVNLGTLDNCPLKPQAHMFVADKANWYEINDDLIQFEGAP